MLRDVGVGAGQADRPVGVVGERRPHLLAGEPPAVPRSAVGARVRSEARSEPAPGSLNSWHQVSSPQQRRAARTAPAARRCRAPGSSAPPSRRSSGRAARPRPPASSSSMTSWVDRVGAQPVRLGPVRSQVARPRPGRRAAGRRAARRSPPPGGVRRRGRRSSRPPRSTSTRRRSPAIARSASDAANESGEPSRLRSATARRR